ncbi:MAG: hypothetical protein ABIF89_01805 [bacterium]
MKLFPKKWVLVSVLVFLQLVLGINNVLAQCPTEGLVPCGTEGCPCTFCHFFVLFQRVINFIAGASLIVAVIFFAIAGVYFITAAGSPQSIKTGQNIIKSTAIGIAIILGSWLITNMLLTGIGVADWTGLEEWFKISCP